MRKFSYLLLAGALFAGVSCATDLSEVYNRLDQLEQKVQNLERLNSTVNGLYTIVSSFENNVYVETVTETEEGYVIKFTDGKTATIKDGDKGPKGDPGDPGAPGETPAIGVADENGQLVWTVNGNVIKDESGKSVPASVSVPEFKFDNNKWWYRFGATDSWKDCGEKTGPEPSITETDEFVIINIGDKSIQIPKEVVSPAIEGLNHVFTAYTENAEGVKTYANRLFIPVGESVDLKDYFEVTPEDALKSMVEYSFTDGAPFTISDKGVLTATGAGSYTVTISAKVNPDIKTSIVIRTCETPNNQELNSTVTSEEKIVIFEGSWDEYQKMSQFGGTTAWNPFNNSMAGIFNGTLNTRIGMESATPNAKVTRDNARLHFMFYVGDASVFQPVELAAGNMLELTSSGVWDVQEIDFDLTKFVPNFKSGWNEVDLALKDATEDATFDPTKANFIRFLCNANTNGAWVAYQIKDLYVYVDDSKIAEINHVFTAYTENAEGVKTYANRLFVPVGKSIDLKEYFEVVPAKLGKSGVDYSFSEGAPFTISEDGILEATGAGSYTVTISAKDNPDIKTSIVIRTCETPNNEEIKSTVNAEEKIVIFGGSWDEYQSMSQFGGTTAWNPFNNSIASIFNGTLNTRVGMLSATPNANVTKDNARLHFMFYVGDASVLQPVDLAAGNMLELTSSGVWDVQEVDFDLTSFVPGFKTGWNEVDLALKDATNDDTFDPTKCNFIRFYCNANTGGEWVAYQIKDLYVYVAPEPVQITIDGDLADWAGVKDKLTSEKETPVYMEFKVWNDDENIYFYTKRDKNSAIWGGGGYIYYDLDTDNNPETGVTKEIPGLETWLYFKPFGGSADAPAIATAWSGEASSSEIPTALQFKGKVSDAFVEVEASLPLSVAGVTKGSTIGVYSWGNKSGDDLKKMNLQYTVK